MSPVGAILWWLLTIFWVLLIFRLIMEWVFTLSRTYRPAGLMAAALEITYTVTDPPLKALRRVIPPLRFGNFAFDLAFFVLFIVVIILRNIVVRF